MQEALKKQQQEIARGRRAVGCGGAGGPWPPPGLNGCRRPGFAEEGEPRRNRPSTNFRALDIRMRQARGLLRRPWHPGPFSRGQDRGRGPAPSRGDTPEDHVLHNDAHLLSFLCALAVFPVLSVSEPKMARRVRNLCEILVLPLNLGRSAGPKARARLARPLPPAPSTQSLLRRPRTCSPRPGA